MKQVSKKTRTSQKKSAVDDSPHSTTMSDPPSEDIFEVSVYLLNFGTRGLNSRMDRLVGGCFRWFRSQTLVSLKGRTLILPTSRQQPPSVRKSQFQYDNSKSKRGEKREERSVEKRREKPLLQLLLLIERIFSLLYFSDQSQIEDVLIT